MRRKVIGTFVICFAASQLIAQQKIATPQANVFKVDNPNYALSPFTGMTRDHWKDAAMYLLRGAFSYVHTIDDPMKFPKQPGKSYPRTDAQVPTEMLEGLCRTLFIAAPLLKEDPSLEINHIKVADYYRYHIQKLVDSNSISFIKHRAPSGGPSQNLVEFGALSLSLFAATDILWDPLPQTDKDALAATMISYGDGPTVPSNWKFFNIFVLSFFKDKGYTVNEKLLVEYLDKSLAHYRGQGWYNDNPAYDYYSMWAFQMYGTLWSSFFGNKYFPAYAQKFHDNFKEVKDNYPYMFARDGEMIMWGRSISYRFGSIIPFPLMGIYNDSGTNYGWMRRISSGAMLQFLQNPSFLQDSVPTLGFYGPFEPAVQSYSCRGSAFWMGKAFLGLLVPKDNPFWTATENEGPWKNDMKPNQVYNKFQATSNILITDYPNIGAAEIRAWCNVPVVGAGEPFRGSENYNRLSYNSAFPWQADGENGEVAMNYVFRNNQQKWEAARLFTFKKYTDGIYYRDLVLETNKNASLKLADIPLPNGILRVDKNTSTDSVLFRLGHYALPGKNIRATKKEVNGQNVQIIDNGVYQLAMVTLQGWDKMEVINTTGLHPEQYASTVINATGNYIPGTSSQPFYISLLLWKRSGKKWTDKELIPIKNISIDAAGHKVSVIFTNKEEKIVQFD